MKAHYILAAAAAATTVLALAAAPQPLPPQWQTNGQNPDKYSAGVDTSSAGRGAKFLRSTTSDPLAWVAMDQYVGAQRYLGQRVRFRARLRTEAISRHAGLWMQVTAANGKTLAFYNSDDKPIVGTTGWQERSVVLDVPADAALVVFGMIEKGTGAVWMEPLALETVGRDVPVDKMPAAAPIPTAPTL